MLRLASEGIVIDIAPRFAWAIRVVRAAKQHQTEHQTKEKKPGKTHSKDIRPHAESEYSNGEAPLLRKIGMKDSSAGVYPERRRRSLRRTGAQDMNVLLQTIRHHRS